MALCRLRCFDQWCSVGGLGLVLGDESGFGFSGLSPLGQLDEPLLVPMGKAELALLLVQHQLLLILVGVFYVLHLPLCIVPGLVLHPLAVDVLQLLHHRCMTDGSVVVNVLSQGEVLLPENGR